MNLNNLSPIEEDEPIIHIRSFLERKPSPSPSKYVAGLFVPFVPNVESRCCRDSGTLPQEVCQLVYYSHKYCDNATFLKFNLIFFMAVGWGLKELGKDEILTTLLGP